MVYIYVCAYLPSRVQLFVTLQTVAHMAPLSMGFFQARILEWVDIFLLQGIFPTQGSTPYLLCFLHCRWILYLVSHQGREVCGVCVCVCVCVCVYTHTHMYMYIHTHVCVCVCEEQNQGRGHFSVSAAECIDTCVHIRYRQISWLKTCLQKSTCCTVISCQNCQWKRILLSLESCHIVLARANQAKVNMHTRKFSSLSNLHRLCSQQHCRFSFQVRSLIFWFHRFEESQSLNS